MSQYLEHAAFKKQSYYRTVIGNHMQAIEWCHFWCPWLTRDPDFKRRAGLSASAWLFCYNNFGKCQPILIILSLLHSQMNCRKSWSKYATSPVICCRSSLATLQNLAKTEWSTRPRPTQQFIHFSQTKTYISDVNIIVVSHVHCENKVR